MNTYGYKRIIAWQKAIDLTELIYQVTDHFPSKETYGIVSQMRRSAVSIPSNIAEGYQRKTTKDYEHFVRISYGSAAELETQLIIAGRVGYLDSETRLQVEKSLVEVLRLISSLDFALRQKMKS